MESESYAEVPMLPSTDEDLGQGSIIFSEEQGIFRSESWESFYLDDVLIDSGFIKTDPDMLMTIWHSPECPLGPWVFDNLEKKYCDETTGPRSERRLLFDRINSAFLEIYQRFIDPCPWVKPATRQVGTKLQLHGVKDELHKLLASQEKRANEDISEMMLDWEMQWLDFGDNMNMIGKDIEKLLINDLITELVVMHYF
ncbi:unnamed protein product [Ilex paraguariensis]|uniref:DUF4378 domain-containing protein n=1 Tax=Ilex paraguariensis TaxID=185542 RepID=A0ABC8RUI7_9AQUA